jgi:UDP-N-acetylglucosamine 2-epimerase (non-hydrolysing)/GDP/UDP-N,N'-diacetylbacillosamine 2-epimerase (hydrolysing)
MKILTITGNRSDYDLISPLLKYLHADPEITLKLLVSGSHLSKMYGYSVAAIREDGFDILCEIESLIASDSKQSRLKSMSLLLQGSIDLVSNFNPDLIIYVGDREEVMVGALLGCYLEKTTLHFWSGDHATDGNTDNAIRHAASKLSSIHMVSLPEHGNRLMSLGEKKNRIFYIGSIALDNFKQHVPLSIGKIKEKLNVKKEFDEFALVIFHPLPSEREEYFESFTRLLEALVSCNISAFINAPNSDPGNHAGLDAINQYRKHSNFLFTKNLPRDLFLSIYKNAKFIIGNSSSGIVESASIPIPAINVGGRQKGRFSAQNVIFCDTGLADIKSAIEKACSKEFLASIREIKNPYGDGKSAEKAYQIIKNLDLKKFIYKTEDPLKIMENING